MVLERGFVSTRLGRYTAGLIEAAWLAAAAGLPLFFNLYSNNIFEPDKTALLRILAWVSLAAWLVKLMDQAPWRKDPEKIGGSYFKSLIRTPLVLPVALLAGVYIISTIFSITPRFSLFGSYARLQGTYTTFSYLVIFACMAGNLRRKSQIERLITTMILTSLPVSLYGVLQHYHLDPISWSQDVSLRAAANLGNPVFLGAYLIMVFPLTAYRILESFDSLLGERGPLGANFIRSSAYIFIAALQLLALFFSGSRGPWLGWIAGLIFALVVLSILWRKPWIVLSGMALAVFGGVFLLLLNIPHGPLSSLESHPTVARLGMLLDAESPTAQVRILIWKGAVNLVLPHQAVQYPDGGQDRFNPIRPLVGYGPESLYTVYTPYYSPELAQAEHPDDWPDRAHNIIWDTLISRGFLGLASYLFLLGSLFHYGLKWLGFMPQAWGSIRFWGLYLGAGAVGAAGSGLGMGPAFLGIGLSFGLLAGVLANLAWAALAGDFEAPRTGEERLRILLVTALLSAVVGHFVEINFGFAVTVTRTYFWMIAATLLATGCLAPKAALPEIAANLAGGDQNKDLHPDPNGANTSPPRIPWLRGALVSGFLSALILVPLGYDFLAANPVSRSLPAILWSSLVHSPTQSNGGLSYAILGMVLMTVFVGGLLLAAESAKSGKGTPWGWRLAVVLGVSILLGLIFWLYHSGELLRIVHSPGSGVDGTLASLKEIENLLVGYTIYFIILTLGLGFFLVEDSFAKNWNSALTAAFAVPVALVLLTFGGLTNLKLVKADMAFKQAGAYLDLGSYPDAIAAYKQAIDLAPKQDAYYISLGGAYLEYAGLEKDAQKQEELMGQAKSALEQAREINPLDPDHWANLARLYSQWATFAPDRETREARARTSSDYYAQAIALSPNSARLWDEWGELDLNLFQQPEAALAKFRRALEIDPAADGPHAALGEYYLQEARSIKDLSQQREVLNQAAGEYRQALELVRYKDVHLRYRYTQALGDIYTQLNQPASAIYLYQRLIELFPTFPDRWQAEEALGKLYLQIGERTQAMEHYKNALASAPEDQQSRLKTLLIQLEAGG